MTIFFVETGVRVSCTRQIITAINPASEPRIAVPVGKYIVNESPERCGPGRAATLFHYAVCFAQPAGPDYTGAMAPDPTAIRIVPLVPNLELPRRASPRTRVSVPPGYGVQEQCLPFTAASGLGLLIPTPISFGHCPLDEVPKGGRAFRSPLPVAGAQADWVFYVEDNLRCQFSANAYRLADSEGKAATLEPGISFFDREDQQDLFKLHLPYVWRTPAEVDTLFLPLLNRAAHGLEVQSGLVETDWYANPVNMIVRKAVNPIHLRAGEEIAQAVFIARHARNPQLEVAAGHSRLTREIRKSLEEWRAEHAKDRGAYKVLARSRQGRIE
jgi:Family of unknown function (DUF6065)